MALDNDLKTLATEGKHFAAVTTMLPSGQPMTQPMWVDADGEHIIVNTEIGRAKYRNVTQNPQVTVTILDFEQPYRYIEARGRLADTVKGDEARAHIDQLSRRYTGGDYAMPIETERVMLKIAIDRVNKQGF